MGEPSPKKEGAAKRLGRLEVTGEGVLVMLVVGATATGSSSSSSVVVVAEDEVLVLLLNDDEEEDVVESLLLVDDDEDSPLPVWRLVVAEEQELDSAAVAMASGAGMETAPG